ncbi:hypothetical protein ACLOJK_020067 [Asimina triloba]
MDQKKSSNAGLYQFSFSQSSVGKDLKYADSHEWVKAEGTSATIGITDHAQDHLGDVVYVELPEVGTSVKQGGSFGAVESVKATSDVNSPVSGKVVEVNTELADSPGLVNASPYENGWIIKVEMSDSNENIPSSVKKKTPSIEGEPPVDGSVQTFGSLSLWVLTILGLALSAAMFREQEDGSGSRKALENDQGSERPQVNTDIILTATIIFSSRQLPKTKTSIQSNLQRGFCKGLIILPQSEFPTCAIDE